MVPQEDNDGHCQIVSSYEAKIRELEEELASVKAAAERREESLVQEREYLKTKLESETKANFALRKQVSGVEAEVERLRSALNSSERKTEMQTKMYKEQLENARNSAEAQAKIFEQKLESAKHLAELNGATLKKENEAVIAKLTRELNDAKVKSMQSEDDEFLLQKFYNTEREFRQVVALVSKSNENAKLLRGSFEEVEKEETELFEKVHQLVTLNQEAEDESFIKMFCDEMRKLKDSLEAMKTEMKIKVPRLALKIPKSQVMSTSANKSDAKGNAPGRSGGEQSSCRT